MKTEDLIEQLAKGTAMPPGPTIGRRMQVALPLGFLVSVVVFLLALGSRPGLWEALAQPIILAKTMIPLGLGLLALLLVQRSATPAAVLGAPRWGVVGLGIAALVLLGGTWLGTSAGLRLAPFLGHSIQVCLPAITLLSVPPLVGLLTALRHGAPVHPARCGALAGLAAAGLAAALYSTFCVEDSPLFYVVWYGLAIGIVTGAGALIGHRWLRW